MNNPAKYLTRKELTAEMHSLGLIRSVPWYGELIKRHPASVNRRLRVSDAIAFLQQNPDFMPRRGERKKRRAKSRGIKLI